MSKKSLLRHPQNGIEIHLCAILRPIFNREPPTLCDVTPTRIRLSRVLHGESRAGARLARFGHPDAQDIVM